MGIADATPAAYEIVRVGNDEFWMRIPAASELEAVGDLREQLRKANKLPDDEKAAEQTRLNRELVTACIVACARDEDTVDSPRTVLDDDQATAWMFRAARLDGTSFDSSDLATCALQFCGMGGDGGLGKALRDFESTMQRMVDKAGSSKPETNTSP